MSRRRGDRRSQQSEAVQSAVWLIGLGVLFLTGWWWPGILILIGLSLILGALAEAAFPAAPSPLPAMRAAPPLPPPPPPPPTPFGSPAPGAPAAAQTARTPPTSPRLPDICPHCGAPPRSLRSLSPDPTLECPYCGSDLRPIAAK